jgi:hypothetical protein
VTTPYDAPPIEVRRASRGWFGVPWWSYVCFDEDGNLIEDMRKAFPVGESCLLCGEEFDEAAGDSGQAMPCVTADGASIRHVHKECSFMNVMGPLAHHEGRCRCHGGTTETPGMTLRQEAVEVWRRMRAGELYGGSSKREDQEMSEMDAGARAKGYEVEARCSIGHGRDALIELPGEALAVRVPLAEVAEGLGIAPRDVPGSRMLVTVRESAESGRVLSGFRPVR